MKNKLKRLYKFLSPKFQTIFLDYKINAKPRLNAKTAPELFSLIQNNTSIYIDHLAQINELALPLLNLKKSAAETNLAEPAWNNGFLPGMDMINLYGMLAIYKPNKYIEIGSGNSTKVARKSIQDFNLNTEITSIDPYPRAEINELADHVIRTPLEDVDNLNEYYSTLEKGDILFIDNSHWSFPNSDVTICLLEILPKLAKGVIVHVHDIYLPYDYPQFMCDRFYNEQYMLAAFLIANPEKYKTILPNYYIYETKDLHAKLNRYWEHPNLQGVEQHGGSFWMEIN